jgi:hypothetical protein
LDATALEGGKIVAAVRDGRKNLRLISWDIDDSGEILRRETITAGEVSVISIVALSNSRIVTAVRDGAHNLLIIVWEIDANGQFIRKGSGSAGEVSNISITAVDETRLVTAVRDGSGKLSLISWSVGPSGEVRRLESAHAGGITEVSSAKISNSIIVTAVANGSGQCQLISWKIGESGNIDRMNEIHAGEASNIDIAFRDNLTNIVTALRNGSGNLLLINWSISQDGSIVRNSDVSGGSVFGVSISTAGGPRFATGTMDGNHNLRLILWSEIGDNYTFTETFIGGERGNIIRDYREAFSMSQHCTSISEAERSNLVLAFRKPIHHSAIDTGAFGRATIGGSEIGLDRSVYFRSSSIERQGGLLHELMHIAGYSHPALLSDPSYVNSAPVRVEKCANLSTPMFTCVSGDMGNLELHELDH